MSARNRPDTIYTHTFIHKNKYIQHTYIYYVKNIYCSRSRISFRRHFIVIAVCTSTYMYIVLSIYGPNEMSHHTLYRPPRPTTTIAAVVVFWRFITIVRKNRGLIFTSKRRYIIRSLLVMHEHCARRMYILLQHQQKVSSPVPPLEQVLHLNTSFWAPHRGLSKLWPRTVRNDIFALNVYDGRRRRRRLQMASLQLTVYHPPARQIVGK